MEISILTEGLYCHHTTDEITKDTQEEESSHHILIYNERVDYLLGVVDAMKVLTSESNSSDLSSFVKDVHYVPALKSAMDLLDKLRQAEILAAITVNKDGSCVGAEGPPRQILLKKQKRTHEAETLSSPHF